MRMRRGRAIGRPARLLVKLPLAGALLLAAAPAWAQFSESYTFLKAIKDRDANKATELVKKPGSSVINTRDPSTGETAIIIAAKRRDTAWLAFALINGCNKELRDNGGDTALTASARIGYEEGVQMLVGQGANVDGASSRGETALILAVQRRDLVMVRELVQDGADPHLADHVSGQSALDYAKADPRGGPLVAMLENAKPIAPKRMVGPQP